MSRETLYQPRHNLTQIASAKHFPRMVECWKEKSSTGALEDGKD